MSAKYVGYLLGNGGVINREVQVRHVSRGVLSANDMAGEYQPTAKTEVVLQEPAESWVEVEVIRAQLGAHNAVSWVKVHSGILGNEWAGYRTKEGAGTYPPS